jgi:hypothetical protein
MGARNQVGIELSYRPASLCSLATQLQTRSLELIPRPIAGLKIPTLIFFPGSGTLHGHGTQDTIPVRHRCWISYSCVYHQSGFYILEVLRAEGVEN